MSESLTGLAGTLLSQLHGAPMQQMAEQLGTDSTQTQSIVSKALPMLLGSLGNNAQQPQGAQALLGALQRDHSDGGFNIGGLMSSVLGGDNSSKQTNGAGILGHIFGGKSDQAASNLASATGLDSGKASILLQTLAPVVMAFLAKRFVGGGNADASQLTKALGQEQAQAKSSGLGGLLGGVLDQDGDGQLGVGDLLKVGGNLLKRS